MMRTVLFTALALAFGSAAYAQPPGVQRYDHNDRYERHEGGVHVFGRIRTQHYGRFADTRWGHDRDRWMQVGRNFDAREPRQEVDLMGQGGRFNTLRVEALSGAPLINRVTIEFMNGEAQVLDINERLRAGQGDVIDLSGDNRRIKRVMVYLAPRSFGEYAVFAG